MSQVHECPHCGQWTAANADVVSYCARCQHRADVPREECDCQQCHFTLPPIPDVFEDSPTALDLPPIPDLGSNNNDVCRLSLHLTEEGIKAEVDIVTEPTASYNVSLSRWLMVRFILDGLALLTDEERGLARERLGM